MFLEPFVKASLADHEHLFRSKVFDAAATMTILGYNSMCLSFLFLVAYWKDLEASSYCKLHLCCTFMVQGNYPDLVVMRSGL